MLEFASDLLLFAYKSISRLIIPKIFGTSQYEYSISLAYFQTLRLSHPDFSFKSISHLIITYSYAIHQLYHLQNKRFNHKTFDIVN
jgi:hypothetical protein